MTSALRHKLHYIYSLSPLFWCLTRFTFNKRLTDSNSSKILRVNSDPYLVKKKTSSNSNKIVYCEAGVFQSDSFVFTIEIIFIYNINLRIYQEKCVTIRFFVFFFLFGFVFVRKIDLENIRNCLSSSKTKQKLNNTYIFCLYSIYSNVVQTISRL